MGFGAEDPIAGCRAVKMGGLHRTDPIRLHHAIRHPDQDKRQPSLAWREHDPDASMVASLARQNICDGYQASCQMRKTTPASIRKPWSDPSL